MGGNALESSYEKAIKQMEKDQDIIFEPGLWWVYWPTSNRGALTEDFLIYLGKYLKEKNRPLIEEYDEYCKQFDE